MSIDLEAIPDEAIRAAERAATAKCSHEDVGDCWQECSDIRAALTAAAPLLRAPLVAEVERLRVIVEAVEKLPQRILNCVDPAKDGFDVRIECVQMVRAALSPSTPLVEPSGVGE